MAAATVIDTHITTATPKPEFIAEGEETITFYSDESSDDYDYHDIVSTTTTTVTDKTEYAIDSSSDDSENESSPGKLSNNNVK